MYFRITAYHPAENISAIFDSNGKFERLWQFSAGIIDKGFKIIEVSGEDKFLDFNIDKAEPDTEAILLRACLRGEPEKLTYKLNGITYPAVRVDDKIYIPDRGKAISGGAL